MQIGTTAKSALKRFQRSTTESRLKQSLFETVSTLLNEEAADQKLNCPSTLTEGRTLNSPGN